MVPNTEAKVTLESKGSRYNLRIDGLKLQEDASRWMPRAFTGLTALMLDVKSSVTASWSLAPAVPIQKPLHPGAKEGLPQFDVIGDDTRPFIVESGKRVAVFVGNSPTITVATSLQRAADAIAKGMQAPDADHLFNDERFRTAVELFGSAAFEESSRAQLLTNAMALEVLAPAIDKHEIALEAIARWTKELEQLMSSSPPDSDEYHALDSLMREMLTRRQASIRSRIRSFVVATLSSHPDVSQLAKNAVKAYDERSTLVHQGTLPGDRAQVAATSLRQITELIIGSRLFGRHYSRVGSNG